MKFLWIITILIVISSLLISFFACEKDEDNDDDDSCIGFVITQSGSTQICSPAGVRVMFSVADCRNNPVSGLTASNFRVINDEKGQTFESEGEAAAIMEALDFDFYSILVLDLSNSIVNNGRLDDVLSGARLFIKEMVENQSSQLKHNVAIYAFGGSSHSDLVQDFTNDHEILYGVLDTLSEETGRGSTDLYGAYISGLNIVESVGTGEMVIKSLVILTDGTDEAGVTSRESALQKKNTSEVNAYAIGIKGDYNEELIRELASEPEYFFLVDDADEISEAFASIIAFVENWSKSNYVMGVCSPLEIPNVSLTIQATKDGNVGSLVVHYDATGFDLIGCSSVAVANGEGCDMDIDDEYDWCSGYMGLDECCKENDPCDYGDNDSCDCDGYCEWDADDCY